MASTYQELKKGAKGNNVAAMQGALRNAGYNVSASGDFDDATEAALKQYQAASGLKADGVAGAQTLGSLYGTGAQPGVRIAYSPSASVEEARRYLQGVQQNAPGAYQSRNTENLQSMLEQINGRGPFKYDVMADPLYNIYKDQYIMNGRRAMQDTMGQAAALTGGYGNSYAASAGQQQYNQYMEGLNAVVPELQNQAYQRYQDEGDALRANYQLLVDQENRDYNRYRDTVADWQTERQLAQSAYDNAYARDFGEYSDERDYWNQVNQYNDNMAWQREQFAANREANDRQYWQSVLSEQQQYAYQTAMAMMQRGQMPSADLLQAAGINEADARLLTASYVPKSTGGTNPNPSPNPDTPTETAAEAEKNAQDFLNSLYTYGEWKGNKESNGYVTNGNFTGNNTYYDYAIKKTVAAWKDKKISDAEYILAKDYLDNTYRQR